MKFQHGEHYVVNIPNNNSKIKKIFLLLYLLQDRIETCMIQFGRIEQDQKSDDKQLLYIDTHFLLVGIGNVLKIFKTTRSHLSENRDFVLLYKKHSSDLERLDKLRDDLEHIDDKRLDGMDKKGNPLTDPTVLGMITNGVYNFAGQEMDFQKTRSLLLNLQEDISEWGSNLKTPAGI